jgi:hypothetical protein
LGRLLKELLGPAEPKESDDAAEPKEEKTSG